MAKVQQSTGQGGLDPAKAALDQAKVQADLMNAQTKQREVENKAQLDATRLQIERDRAQAEAVFAAKELKAKAADRAMKERIQLVDLAQNLAVHPMSAELVTPLIRPALQEVDEQEGREKGEYEQ